ncbi:LLM class flavin-dependent oxidoreductase [Streptomyces sp. ISL-36]|uniref:LLM class flavin-dependent oxidoreductase n=1 Tax=Streptomyces sp. ISL-36 TaxID=2819182 RepID=UPI001BE8472E|nr:LLM class flavin-dependent oxidoreductase [Streptomyces sp. ISL-36]MBT2442555.1 LLM class flavin-dependent oxidoreductase [Streptomyces sp. ISL-36]
MTSPGRIPLSVLDVVPVFEDGSATAALRDTVALAPRVEALGYHRYWVAEHHNTRSLATSAPGILIGRLAAATSTLRVGSGGVLLPNHAPLVVAEQFGTLEALHPGRIDLGLGRAPGTDPVTARALRRSPDRGEDDFPRQIAELGGYFAPGDPDSGIVAVPAADGRPDLWMLGSSPASAEAAGALGLPYAFAHQINPHASAFALDRYRASFRPSAHLDRPRTLVSVLVTVAETDEAARAVASPYLLGKIRMRTVRRFDAFPSTRTAAAHAYSAAERSFLDELVAPQLIGAPDTVRDKLAALLARTGADEVMALTVVHDQEDRLRSFELLAEAARGTGPADGAGPEAADGTVVHAQGADDGSVRL